MFFQPKGGPNVIELLEELEIARFMVEGIERGEQPIKCFQRKGSQLGEAFVLHHL